MEKRKITKEAIGKVTLYSAERDNKYGIECAPCPPSASFPCLFVNGKEAPALEGKKVGDEFIMVVKAKVKSHSLRESLDSEKCEDFDIQVQKIGIVNA